MGDEKQGSKGKDDVEADLSNKGVIQHHNTEGKYHLSEEKYGHVDDKSLSLTFTLDIKILSQVSEALRESFVTPVSNFDCQYCQQGKCCSEEYGLKDY